MTKVHTGRLALQRLLTWLKQPPGRVDPLTDSMQQAQHASQGEEYTIMTVALSHLPVFVILLPKIWQVVCKATHIVKPFTAQATTGDAVQSLARHGTRVTEVGMGCQVVGSAPSSAFSSQSALAGAPQVPDGP